MFRVYYTQLHWSASYLFVLNKKIMEIGARRLLRTKLKYLIQSWSGEWSEASSDHLLANRFRLRVIPISFFSYYCVYFVRQFPIECPNRIIELNWTRLLSAIERVLSLLFCFARKSQYSVSKSDYFTNPSPDDPPIDLIQNIPPPMPEESSFFILSNTSAFRIFCHEICTRNIFINFVLISITISSILLAAEDPLRIDTYRNEVLAYFDYIFTGIFTVCLLECCFHSLPLISQHNHVTPMDFLKINLPIRPRRDVLQLKT